MNATKSTWTYHKAMPATATAPTLADDGYNLNIHDMHAARYLMLDGPTHEQWQNRDLRLVIARERDGLSVSRLQRHGYPMVRICFAPAHLTVEQLQSQLEAVAPQTANVPQWESDVRAALGI